MDGHVLARYNAPTFLQPVQEGGMSQKSHLLFLLGGFLLLIPAAALFLVLWQLERIGAWGVPGATIALILGMSCLFAFMARVETEAHGRQRTATDRQMQSMALLWLACLGLAALGLALNAAGAGAWAGRGGLLFMALAFMMIPAGFVLQPALFVWVADDWESSTPGYRVAIYLFITFCLAFGLGLLSIVRQGAAF